ncbi:hypothetical protein PspLS_06494 [Pyricularia sp. CBS 133598]|nr:hypothetical protein PspLS_06494 [Pyricularia sp. CBS 133598]
MARHVIQDSDDEGSDLSPLKSPVAPGPAQDVLGKHVDQPDASPAPSRSGSTDPSFFQRIYDEHNQNRSTELSRQPQADNEPSIDSGLVDVTQNTRSSLTDPTMTKVARSKTARVANAQQSSACTQVTTPGRAACEPENEVDIWDIPISPEANIPERKSARKAAPASVTKVYGKRRKISHQSVDSEDSRYADPEPPSPATPIAKRARHDDQTFLIGATTMNSLVSVNISTTMNQVGSTTMSALKKPTTAVGKYGSCQVYDPSTEALDPDSVSLITVPVSDDRSHPTPVNSKRTRDHSSGLVTETQLADTQKDTRIEPTSSPDIISGTATRSATKRKSGGADDDELGLHDETTGHSPSVPRSSRPRSSALESLPDTQPPPGGFQFPQLQENSAPPVNATKSPAKEEDVPMQETGRSVDPILISSGQEPPPEGPIVAQEPLVQTQKKRGRKKKEVQKPLQASHMPVETEPIVDNGDAPFVPKEDTPILQPTETPEARPKRKRGRPKKSAAQVYNTSKNAPIAAVDNDSAQVGGIVDDTSRQHINANGTNRNTSYDPKTEQKESSEPDARDDIGTSDGCSRQKSGREEKLPAIEAVQANPQTKKPEEEIKDEKLLRPSVSAEPIKKETASCSRIGSQVGKATYRVGLTMPLSVYDADEEAVSPSSAYRTNTTTHSDSQRYLSTRGEDIGFRFQDTVLTPLSSDGGFYLPEGTPTLSLSDLTRWKDFSFRDVALAIFSLFISPAEIPAEHLGQIVDVSLAGVPNASFAPVTRVDQHHGLYLAELYHGPGGVHQGFGLKVLGAFLDYFLEKENVSLAGQVAHQVYLEKHHVTVIDGLAGDVGFAAGQAFLGRRNVSFVSLQPTSEMPSTDISESPDTSGINVHAIGMKSVSSQNTKQIAWQLARESKPGCVQDLETLLCGSWPRTLAGVASYFYVYFQIARTAPSFRLGKDKVSFGVPTTDWDIMAAFVARRMGLPVERIIVATSQPDGPLDRLWATGRYESDSLAGNNSTPSMTTTIRKIGPLDTTEETLPPGQHAIQMEPEFLVSGHVERLFWFLAYDFVTMAGHDIMDAEWDRRQAGGEIQTWLRKLRSKGGFGPVYQDVLESGRRCFGCERTGRPQVQGTVAEVYQGCGGLVVDLGAAAAIKAAIKSIKTEKMAGSRSQATVHVVLGLADPALKVEELEETLGSLARTRGVSTCLQKVLNRSRELEERRAAGRVDMHIVAETMDEVKAAVETITWAAIERAE